MGSNYFLVPPHVLAALKYLENLRDQLYDSYEKYPDYFYDNPSFMNIIRGFDDHPEVLHIGRRTNNLFIWNFDPDTLQERATGMIILHETGSAYGSLCEFYDEVLYGQIYDLEHVGKNQWFR